MIDVWRNHFLGKTCFCGDAVSIFFAQVVCCGHAQKALCLETQLCGIQNGLRQHFSDVSHKLSGNHQVPVPSASIHWRTGALDRCLALRAGVIFCGKANDQPTIWDGKHSTNKMVMTWGWFLAMGLPVYHIIWNPFVG